jgi:hypothetical protein
MFDADGITEELDYYVQGFVAGPHSSGRTPSIHDAILDGFSDAYEGFLSLDHSDEGWHTWFLRPVRHSGMIGTWQRVTAYLEWV